jgi:hypothetical protein
MALTVADLAQHIETLRRLYARVLEADIELLRRGYGESIVQEALRLADKAAQPKQAPPKQAPQPPSPDHAREIGDALGRVMAERSSTDQDGGKRRLGDGAGGPHLSAHACADANGRAALPRPFWFDTFEKTLLSSKTRDVAV